MVLCVCQVEIASGVESEGCGEIEVGVGGGAVVAVEAWGGRARDGGDDAGGEVEFANAVVMRVGDVEVVGEVYCEALWRVELGSDGGA